MLSDIARKFIDLRGSNCLHLAVAHLEKSHPHIHIITSGVTVHGTSSRMSRSQFTQLLSELETYQQKTYPELNHSTNTHDKGQVIERITGKRKTTKLLLHDNLRRMLLQSPTYEAFSNRLAAHNYDLYYRNGNPQGIIVDNIKYRFSSLGIESSLIPSIQAEDRILEDLAEIRNREIVQQATIDKEKAIQIQELEELQHIRIRGKEIEGIERDIETEYKGMGVSHQR